MTVDEYIEMIRLKTSVLLAAALKIGAILPLLQGILADVLGSWRWSWFIVLLGEIFMLYYALIGSRIRQTAD